MEAWGMVVVLMAVILMTAAADSALHQAVVCLVNDSPAALQDELYLHCAQSGSINIRSALHGFREQAEDARTCGPPTTSPPPTTGANAGCQTVDPAFLRSVRTRCMGGSTCYVPVARVFLEGCKMSSNYVYVEYECVSDNTMEPDNIVDICGEMLQGTRVSRPKGYIRTPDYPDLYPPDISCSCNLTALGAQAQVTLTLLDIQLQAPAAVGCHWDWLEYTVPPHGWGRGVRICHTAPGADTTFSANKTVVLNFRADSRKEDRGFWLKYEGWDAGGAPAEVLLHCKNFQPNIVRKASACLRGGEPAGELFLDCQKDGVINVLSAQFGRRPLGDAGAPCTYQVAPVCAADATSDRSVLRTCMGQGSCRLPVSPQPLPPCAAGTRSDYLQVKYQCIPEAYEPTNIVDVCGDVLSGKAAFRHSGYIQSPRYPHFYPHSLACQCLLSTNRDASIHLGVLDVRLSSDTVSAACDADWLTYSTSHAAPWGGGSRLCHAPRGHTVNTKAYEVRVDFFSDSSIEDRGFWLHYSAVRPDGLHVGVQIMCQPRRPQYISDTGEGATPLSPRINTGLVVGLAFIALLIIGILFVLAILKYKRIQKDKLQETPETSVVGEKVGAASSFKRYQSQAENYHTLHDTSRPSPEPRPDYDINGDTSRGQSGSYVNPAYDGTLEPASYHNVAC